MTWRRCRKDVLSGVWGYAQRRLFFFVVGECIDHLISSSSSRGNERSSKTFPDNGPIKSFNVSRVRFWNGLTQRVSSIAVRMLFHPWHSPVLLTFWTVRWLWERLLLTKHLEDHRRTNWTPLDERKDFFLSGEKRRDSRYLAFSSFR